MVDLGAGLGLYVAEVDLRVDLRVGLGVGAAYVCVRVDSGVVLEVCDADVGFGILGGLDWFMIGGRLMGRLFGYVLQR